MKHEMVSVQGLQLGEYANVPSEEAQKSQHEATMTGTK